ncbi:MAG: hypothetical protein E7464_03580, partial [Ruminococcaceae bacterium]|nr:hypothetical protein [Oscillospiraceae bacterium]
MKGIKKFIALTLCAVILLGTVSGMVPTPAQAAEASEWKYGLDGAMGWNEDTYYTISKRTNNDNWRQGLASANGEIAFMESGDPDEDVFIFNNTKIVYDGNGLHEVPYLADIIEEQREGAINFNNWVWNQAANQYDEQTYGINGGRGMVWSRPYQPAAQYRIKNNDFTGANRTNYNRYTNYETAEVGAQWKDAQGNEWNRRSFASREDDVIVTYIEAPAGKDLNLTVTMDHITDMRNEGTLDSHPTTDYVVTQEGGSVVGFGTVGKYVTRNQMGSRNPNKTLFSYGGWASATRIVMGSGGNVAYTAATRTVAANSGFAVQQAYQANDPQLKITGTNSVMLITKVDRQDDGCNDVNDVRQKLYDRLQGEIAELVEEKDIESTEAGYQTLLAPHKEIHGDMFNNVRIDLCQTEAEKADRLLTNQQLIQKQNENKDEINKAFLERVYNNGRYGLICAHGYGSTRLSAIWCGTWNPSWSGDYTLDANTNLQVSGLNTGNMMEAGQGYINFIVRMVADWETNAERIYGMEDAILGPPRVDGTGQGQSYHYGDVYPHVFVNGITDWLLIPIFEYWQCYGNQQIELGKDIDLERNMSVLDWTEADIARIRANGCYDLEQDVLYPLSIKAMNFWLQFADENYYTDGSGRRHVNDGTTLSDAIAKGDEDAKYIFAPGYSPENSPEKGGATVQALAYNVTMDISAARDSLFIARTMLEKFDPESELFAQWDEFEKRIPDYLYEPKTGELKEWASYDLKEAHNHRHESHAYGAWPGYEAQDNEALREGIAIAMDMRSAAYNGQEATESHGATHKALVEARLKRPVALERVMLYLLTNGYQYSNMLTSHNRNNSSCLCTDSAFGLMGAVNESMMYSNTGIIEILPTLLPNLDKGSITGLRARNNTEADIAWDKAKLTAAVTLTTDEDATELTIMCGLDWEKATIGGKKQTVYKDELGRPYITVALTKGTPVEVSFSLTPEEATETREAYGKIAANSYDIAKRDFGNAEDGSIGETRSLDYIAFRGMDFGVEGSKPRMVLTASSKRTEGGLNGDGTCIVRVYTDDPADGYPAFAEVVIPNTNGIYQDFEVELPARLTGVQDIYIKFQDGGCNLKSLEFFAMPIANVEDGEDRSISRQNPLILELNTDSFSYTLNGSAVQSGKKITEPGEWTLVVRHKEGGAVYQTIRFTTYISDANRLLPKTVSLKPGESLILTENLNDPDVNLWLAPPRASVFTESSFMTRVPGDKDQITVPGAEGTYALAVVDTDGKLLSRSDAVVKVSASGLADIDFTDPDSANSFEIINPNASSIRDGQGLYMITTKDGFEPANDQLSGDAASNPKDLVLIPVQGDWEATLQFNFSQANADNGYYQFFGFYAMQDYQNAAGIRGGDGAMQDFLRKNGAVTAETMNSQPGLASNGTYWYRITKEGTTYTCSRSENGQDFDEMFSFSNAGIEAKNIAIDAYTGMTEGYTFMLKSLVFTGNETAPHEHSYETVITQPTCVDKGYTTHICILCGESYVDGETAPLGHNYEGGKCTRCGKDDPNPGCPGAIFSDMPAEDHWAHPGIDYCVENELMNGTGEGKFSPEGTLTRAQLVTILYRVENEPAVELKGTFSDVPADSWYSKAVEWAEANGIVNGIGGGKFAPEAVITREQIATILYRYEAFKNGAPKVEGDLKAFPDASNVSTFATTAMVWAIENEIITGASVNNVTYLNP